MSEAVRAVALAEATKLKGDTGDSAVILETANLYLAFLQGGATGPATRTAAGAEPEKKAESKPSTTTATGKPAKAAKPTKAEQEAAAAAAALAKANEEAADEETGPSEAFTVDAFTADAEGVSAAVAAMIANKSGEGPNRDTAIALLKKYKAASVSAMQKQAPAKVAEFIGEVNEAFGLSGGEPDLES